MADMELKQAFADLQKKMIETQTQMRVADAQIAQLEITKKRSDFTAKELQGMPESTKQYQSVGRMFMLQSQDEIQEMLKQKQVGASEKIKELEGKKKYLEKTVKESEANLREMVSQKRK